MTQSSHIVLLVDDDQRLLRGLQRSLEGEPYEIVTAGSAGEAAAALARYPVDVIVSDEQMPGMSGTEFLKRVQEEFPDVVRIVLSGNVNVQVALRAINEGGVFRLFTKPCNVVDLAIAIRQALQLRDRTNGRSLADEAKMLQRLHKVSALPKR